MNLDNNNIVERIGTVITFLDSSCQFISQISVYLTITVANNFQIYIQFLIVSGDSDLVPIHRGVLDWHHVHMSELRLMVHHRIRRHRHDRGHRAAEGRGGCVDIY